MTNHHDQQQTSTPFGRLQVEIEQLERHYCLKLRDESDIRAAANQAGFLLQDILLETFPTEAMRADLLRALEPHRAAIKGMAQRLGVDLTEIHARWAGSLDYAL